MKLRYCIETDTQTERKWFLLKKKKKTTQRSHSRIAQWTSKSRELHTQDQMSPVSHSDFCPICSLLT